MTISAVKHRKKQIPGGLPPEQYARVKGAVTMDIVKGTNTVAPRIRTTLSGLFHDGHLPAHLAQAMDIVAHAWGVVHSSGSVEYDGMPIEGGFSSRTLSDGKLNWAVIYSECDRNMPEEKIALFYRLMQEEMDANAQRLRSLRLYGEVVGYKGEKQSVAAAKGIVYCIAANVHHTLKDLESRGRLTSRFSEQFMVREMGTR